MKEGGGGGVIERWKVPRIPWCVHGEGGLRLVVVDGVERESME